MGFCSQYLYSVAVSFGSDGVAGDSLGDCLQDRVRTMIKDSQAKGEMWTRDWDNVPLPIVKLGAPHDVLPSPPPPANGRPSK